MSIYLFYPGIFGNSTDASHRGWIPIESIKYKLGRRITSHSGTRFDRESSNMETRDLILGKHMDASSPALFLASCCGTGKTAKLRLGKTGAGNNGTEVFLEYTLHHALVSDYDVLASARSRQRPIERIVISFVNPEVRYTPYDEDGHPLPPISVGFSTEENIKI